jgi:hypothetical protein
MATLLRFLLEYNNVASPVTGEGSETASQHLLQPLIAIVSQIA